MLNGQSASNTKKRSNKSKGTGTSPNQKSLDKKHKGAKSGSRDGLSQSPARSQNAKGEQSSQLKEQRTMEMSNGFSVFVGKDLFSNYKCSNVISKGIEKGDSYSIFNSIYHGK